MRRIPILFLLLGLPVFAALNGFIQPNNITVAPLQQQQFTLPGYAQAISWSVQPPGMGTITPNGLYTAPNTSGIAFVYAQPQGAPLYVTTVYLSQGLQGPSGTTGPTTSGQGPTMPTYPGGQNPSPASPTLYRPQRRFQIRSGSAILRQTLLPPLATSQFRSLLPHFTFWQVNRQCSRQSSKEHRMTRCNGPSART